MMSAVVIVGLLLVMPLPWCRHGPRLACMTCSSFYHWRTIIAPAHRVSSCIHNPQLRTQSRLHAGAYPLPHPSATPGWPSSVVKPVGCGDRRVGAWLGLVVPL